MASETKGLFKQLRSGMVFEAAGPSGTGFGEILEALPTRIDARISPNGPIAGRVLVRVPLEAALLTFSARVSLRPQRDPGHVRLDAFSGASVVERRTADRLHEPVRVSITTSGETKPFRVLPALNVSARGLLLGWPGNPDAALGERLDLTITLGGCDFALGGDVVRVEGEQTAIRFESIPDSTRDAIIAHVFRRQIERKRVDDPFLDMEKGMEE